VSYSLIPMVIDLKQVTALMGSKDTALLQAVIKKYRKEMLGIDSIVGEYEDFQAEFKKEYRAFEAGDFSGVNLQATYDEADESEDEDELDPEDRDFQRAHKAAKTEAERKRLIEAWTQKAINDILAGGLEEDDEAEDEEDPHKAISTGAALVHLILGGNLDPSAWSQYGYALRFLCEHVGTIAAEHDAWTSIGSEAFELADKILKRAGVPSKKFSTNAFLVERGSPVKLLEPDDFPYIGYLKRDEIRRVLPLLDAKAIEAALSRVKEDADWARDALSELRGWLHVANEAERDLIFFYC
jgi:hypothetical protein